MGYTMYIVWINEATSSHFITRGYQQRFFTVRSSVLPALLGLGPFGIGLFQHRRLVATLRALGGIPHRLGAMAMAVYMGKPWNNHRKNIGKWWLNGIL